MDTRKLSKIAITAAVYVVATVAIAPLSYGAIQLRFSEIMTLLAYIDPVYIPGLVLGCALSNLYSPLGIIDVFIGTIATFISVYMISKTKNLLLASIWPTAINSVFIGAELYFVLNQPFLISTFYIAIGQFLVVTLIGYPVFKLILKNKSVVNILKY
ncbi:queuosine precursor transporter QueT [Clostridium acetireducens DSM 10703]|uniref:Queuosine transporter QueT n=1 Tax=Clostridium acetireducens DSM 10703 TaxID=1121290 RepID=A0A1E8F0Q4_9CLOT|nr:QueT transporter family protein [Clostridium acetireducens]OFI07000.1 queuosine precursor transporter QueT [Clostridium acetireducens DSM 10703]